VNLDLTKFSFPFAALASITHRISGVVLFGLVGVALWILDLSLQSEAGFAYAESLITGEVGRFVLWASLAALAYHLCAGLKHLALDFHIGDSLEGGRIASYLSVTAAVALMVVAGVWLW
jgi:succinate dehydrogenase / fumarate reductase cytochrome b subunit